MDMKKSIVVAVGGNALIKNPKNISIQDQQEAVDDAVKSLVGLVEEGYIPVITHGNGPQVGFLLSRAEIAQELLPLIPLDVLGADTQGATGYMFTKSLRNEMNTRGLNRPVAALVTQCLVDTNDPAFENPTKPIGSFMNEAEAEERRHNAGWILVEDSGRGFRRVVPSPEPKKILETETIKELMNKECIVIAVGGGGIPVRETDNGFEGVEAVIDKDFASSLLASDLGVEDFVICTAVEQVCVGFNTDHQRGIDKMSVSEAEKLIADGEFGKGSMEPKVQAAINFIKKGGKRVIITSLDKVADALADKTGTTIVP